MTFDKLSGDRFTRAIISADQPFIFTRDELCTPHDFVELILSGQRQRAVTSLETLSDRLPGQYPPEGIEPADAFIMQQKSIFAMGVAEVVSRRPDIDGRLVFNIQDALDEAGFPAVSFQNHLQRLSLGNTPLFKTSYDEPLF